MQLERPGQRGQRVVGVALAQLGAAEQEVEVGIARVLLQRVADQRRRRSGIAAIEQGAEAVEALLERRVREPERPAQERAGLRPVRLLEARQPALEGARLLDPALARQRAQRRQRLADQPFARVEQRALDARRDVAGVKRERGVQRPARLGAPARREQDAGAVEVEIRELGPQVERGPERALGPLPVAGVFAEPGDAHQRRGGGVAGRLGDPRLAHRVLDPRHRLVAQPLAGEPQRQLELGRGRILGSRGHPGLHSSFMT